MGERKFLTVKELSERWGGSPCVGTLNNWRSKRKPDAPPFVKIGNKVLYPLDSLEKWEREREQLASNDNAEGVAQ